MSETFEVGQKVRHGSFDEDGEIKFGPFRKAGTYLTGYYLVDFGDGACRETRGTWLSAIPEPPKFAIGDKVRLPYGAREGSLVAGPFRSRHSGRTFWVMETADGKHEAPSEVNLTKVTEPAPIEVGDRVRVLKDDPVVCTGAYVGKIGIVQQVGGCRRKPLTYRLDFGDGDVWWVEDVERVEAAQDEDVYTHAGVTYDLTATYRDRDGDDWTFKRFGDEVRGGMNGTAPLANTRTLDSVVAAYGPLTRI
ncbi:phiSA1p31-related protein [Streptomyces sp. NPDC005813]|uniref:phiSA1p31-related protein n=1 Tax=Streptomyces sp. NPDC005813 TaxID=3155592 RepID=UPI0034025BD4